MPYPDLGCFAECLDCELCDEPLEDDELDLFDLGEIYGGDDGIPNWSDPDWGPEPAEDGGLFDDFPTGIPLGEGWELRPTWDPYGLEFHGEL